MPSLKHTYFGVPGRGEPTRLALALGGVACETEDLDDAMWAARKDKVAPKLLPLLVVDGKLVGQSMAQTRYAAKLSKVDGQPLYPEDPLEALLVDEFCDYVNEVYGPLVATYAIADEAEQAAARAKLITEGGDAHKWLKYVDDHLATSASGFVVGGRLTIADLVCHCFIQPLAGGFISGVPADCLGSFKHIGKHRAKIAAIPAIKAHYANAEGLFKTLQ